jgi:flagellar basal body rod protein FlgF
MARFAHFDASIGFNTGRRLVGLLTTILANFALAEPGVNAKTGTAYTLALTDDGRTVTSSNAAAQTVTVPANATVAFPIGTEIAVLQAGAGALSVAAAGGVTINKPADRQLTARGQNSVLRLRKTATNVWTLGGDLADVSSFVTSNAADYVPVITDRVIDRSLGTAMTTTIPPNSAVAFALGTVLEVIQSGAGINTIAAGGGVTLVKKAVTLATSARYGVVRCIKIATDTWVVNGDLT